VNEDSIVHEVLYPHPIWRVWQALTSADALAQWLMPNDFEARLGQRFTFRTAPQHGWSGIVECEVVELEPPERLAYTWSGGPQLPLTLVSFTLAELGPQTRLRLVHSGFASGGPSGISIRDLLDSGWGSNILRKQLPELLKRLASRV
jgi:uncharacterized protein YndB with AHSA1/START domain